MKAHGDRAPVIFTLRTRRRHDVEVRLIPTSQGLVTDNVATKSTVEETPQPYSGKFIMEV
jgi:mRNA-degrading endonuclease toxin of MazEF toxin-antitoxin module